MILFVLAGSFPWYYERGEINLIQTRRLNVAFQFFYEVAWDKCSADYCDLNMDFEYWEFSSSTTMTRLVFGLSWSFTILGGIYAVLAMFKGEKYGTCALTSAILTTLGICCFFFISPAIRSDSSYCNAGPCDSFAGSNSFAGQSVSWGPTFGFYFAVAAVCWMVILYLLECCCCSSRKKSKQHTRGKQSETVPIINHSNEKIVYSTPASTAPPAQEVHVPVVEYEAPPPYVQKPSYTPSYQ